jgi:hypothetical protein
VAKLTFQPAFLSLSNAAKRFHEASDLLAALKEGSLTARGRRTADFTGANGGFGAPIDPIYGDPEPIPTSAWRDWKVLLSENIVQNDQDYAAFVDVEILAADLETNLAGRPSGGRPVSHDWELILKQVIVRVSEKPIEDITLNAWINDLASNLPYCETNKVPTEDALTKKLRDVFQAVKGEKPLPVGRPLRRV